MEAAIINFISFAFFLCFLILVHTQWKKKAKSSGKLPPGPWKLPIIGNLLHLMSGSLPAHRVLSDLAKRYGSSSGLMLLKLGEIPAVIVSSRDMAKEFLRTHDLAFASRPELTASKILFYNCWDVALSPYGDHWRQIRKICVTELLNPKIVRSFGSIRSDEIHRLLAHLRSSLGRPVNMSQRIALFMSSLTCRSALGSVFSGREELVELLEEISGLLGSFEFADTFPSWKLLHSICGNKNRMLQVHRKVDPIIENIIKEHEMKLESGELGDDDEGEDIIGVLVKLQKNGGHQLPITHDIIKGVFLDIFAGGTETSSTTIVWALSEMMKNPRVFAKAQAEVREAFRGKEKLEEDDIQQLQYLNSVVKETLRCHPPIPLLIPRECREETVVGGYTIPLKARVHINVWAIGRDPQYWKDPESFIPERFENNSSIDLMGNSFEYLPFGSGRRTCPGLAFGFANSLSPLAHLLYHFDWKLPPGITVDTFDLTETPGISVGKKTDLVLIPATPIK
ncbi:premnaspirodiene oxygenase-like [Ipomoea triloba]|uniref:premnaspirodiene oxygenase-like n=1 Tax=Ipomoea triloba TaxID=35885 RepID=UPI00125D27EB|nr:premnaspirodiene oxygenase-like [Ipomoea triloba]